MEDIRWAINSLGGMRKGSREYEMRQNLINQKTPCYLLNYAFKMEEIATRDIFIFHGEAFMNFLKMFNPIFRKDIFISDQPFESPLAVHYLSKSIPRSTRAEFDRQASIYFENGFKFRAFREANKMFDQLFPRIKNKNIFRNAREYVSHYTLISKVELNDFTFVFLFYIVWSLMLFVSTLHKLTKQLRRLLVRLKSALWFAQSNLLRIISGTTDLLLLPLDYLSTRN